MRSIPYALALGWDAGLLGLREEPSPIMKEQKNIRRIMDICILF